MFFSSAPFCAVVCTSFALAAVVLMQCYATVTIIMNVIKCGVYLRAATISLHSSSAASNWGRLLNRVWHQFEHMVMININIQKILHFHTHYLIGVLLNDRCMNLRTCTVWYHLCTVHGHGIKLNQNVYFLKPVAICSNPFHLNKWQYIVCHTRLFHLTVSRPGVMSRRDGLAAITISAHLQIINITHFVL